MVKNVPATTADAKALGSIPGSGRPPGEGNDYPLQYSAWRSPWMEEPGRLQYRGCKESDVTKVT